MQFVSIILAVVVGFGAGWFINDSQSSHADHKDSTEKHVGHHSHTQMEVPEGEPLPSVDLIVHEDPKGGYNAQMVFSNFALAPERVSTEHVPGEGHAHIYVDGNKINRVYGEWYHLGALTPGEREIAVTLSTNDHQELVKDGVRIEDVEVVAVPEKEDTHDDHASHDEEHGDHEEKMDMSDVEPTGETKSFSLTVENKTLIEGDTTLSVTEGDMVTISVTADENEEFHIHGYNETIELTAGQEGEVTFLAGASGRFPFELELSKTELGALEVNPQ